MTKPITITASGDALITRKLPQEYTGKREVAAFLARGDVRITNLETTVTDLDCFPSTFSGGTWLTAPEEVLEDVKSYGFNICSIANNHMLDYSFGGLRETMAKLKQHHLPFTGAGESLEDAARPVIQETAQGKVAFLALTSTFDDTARAGLQGPYLPARPGINFLRHQEIHLVTPEQLQQLRTIADSALVNVKSKRRLKTGYKLPVDPDIVELKDLKFKEAAVPGKTTIPDRRDLERTEAQIRQLKQTVDVVVVMLHSHEMKDDSMETIDDFIIESARRFIDAGADLILGGGCHQLKAIEVYRGKPIFYSLGNFIYQNDVVGVLPPDFMEKYHLPLATTAREALAARKSHAKGGGMQAQENYLSVLPRVCFQDGACRSITLFPVGLGYEKAGEAHAIPYPATAEERETIFRTLCRLSEPLGTKLVEKDGMFQVELG